MSAPLFSIITPSYNSAFFLTDTINSVISQTLSDWEMIIVDDFSSDETLSIIKFFSEHDERIKLLKHPENRGVAVARNTAIKEARGRYIAFLDSDDQWLPNKLELQLEQFEKGAMLVFSSYFRCFDNGSEKIVTVPESVSYNKLLMGNCIGNLTGSYNSERLGKFYQESIGHEDYLMWLNIIKQAHFAVGIQQPLARYHVGSDSLSSSKIKSAKWTWSIYRNNLNMGFIESSHCFIKYVFSSLRKRI